jgi:hypothetical protein
MVLSMCFGLLAVEVGRAEVKCGAGCVSAYAYSMRTTGGHVAARARPSQ